MTLLSRMIIALFMALPLFVRAESPTDAAPLSARARFQPSTVEAGGTAELIVEMQLAEKYHAYRDKFKLTLEDPKDLKLDDFKISPTVQFKDSVSKGMKEGVEGKATLRALVEIPVGTADGARETKFKLVYQACTSEYCLFPKTILLDVQLRVAAGGGPRVASGTSSATIGPTTAPVAEAGGTESDFERSISKGLLPALGLMFVVGFLTSLTPCIYPMIPITLAVLGARKKDQSHLRSFALALTYVLGIALTYSSLGLLAATTGSLFGSALGNIWVVSGIALLFVAMAFSMFGLYEIQAPAFIRNRMGAAQGQSTGFVGAFGTGLVAGIVASPCVGPVLVSVLAYIAKSQDQMVGFLLLFSFAMGMGILFIALGLSSSFINRLPKAGGWMEDVKYIFGAVMIGMALYYIKPVYPEWLFHTLAGFAVVSLASAFGAFEPGASLSMAGRVRKGIMTAALIIGSLLIALGVLSRLGVALPAGASFASQESFPKLDWKPYSQASLDEAVKSGRPVIIDFMAEWCGACKELERYTFVDPRIRDLSAGFTLLKVDATEDFPELAVLKTRYEVVGLPTMIFYDRQGKIRRDLTLTGFEDADAFLKRMGAL